MAPKEPTCFFVWSHCPTVCIDVEELWLLWLLTWRRVVLDEAKVVVAEVAARHAVLEASHAYAPKVACAPLLRDLILGPVSKTASFIGQVELDCSHSSHAEVWIFSADDSSWCKGMKRTSTASSTAHARFMQKPLSLQNGHSRYKSTL